MVWAEYIKAVDKLVQTHAIANHASKVHTEPTSSRMSCHWCFELPSSDNFLKQNLWNELLKVVRIFKQASIAWHESPGTKYILGYDDGEPSAES